jgi:hypothetical protein
VDPTPEDPFADDADDLFGHEAGEGYGLDEASEEGEGTDDNHTALPPRVEAWRQRSAVGAILTGFALGLQEALEPKREEPAIVMETSGEPPSDLPVESDFEFRRPRESVVHIRPWLLDSKAGNQAADQAGNQAADRAGNQAADQAGNQATDRAGDPPPDQAPS